MVGYVYGFSSLTSINFNGLSSLSSVGEGWMNGWAYGFSSLTSIDFSGLSSLSSVGEGWMFGEDYGFSNMTDIYVGDVNWKTGFSANYFCESWLDEGTIHGTQASSWQKGGISGWSTST